MRAAVAVSVVALALYACTSTAPAAPAAGSMSAGGSIQQCTGTGRDVQACGNAIFNATVIEGIHHGQTSTEVRAIMKHAAERREIAANVESWGYITSYQNKMLTWITFTDDRVSSLSHEIWVRD